MTDVAEAPVQEEATAGTLLRRAREAAGLHVAALAVSLKVPVRKLEALEEDRYDDLGDAVFIRGLASSVCRALKADPQPVLERLPQTSAPRLIKATDGLNAPFRAPGDGPMPTWIDRVRQPVPATVIVLLAAAVVIYILPVARHEEKAVAQAPAPVAAPAPAPAAPVAQDTATDAALSPAASASEPVAVPVATPVAAQPAPAASQIAAAPQRAQPAPAPSAAPVASAAAQAAAAPANGIVVIHAKGESWVEVVDSKGAVPVRKLLQPGESVGASGALPLTVTVGKVDMTDVEVRGKKFDMRPVSKDNVARFTVK
jgi:cytoskeleton protein RodZ